MIGKIIICCLLFSLNAEAYNFADYIFASAHVLSSDDELKAISATLNNYNEGYEKCDFHKLTGWVPT